MSDTNRAVQAQNMARDLNFRMYEVKGLYYPSSENKGADLRVCFRICKNPVFSRRGSNMLKLYEGLNGVFLKSVIRKILPKESVISKI